MTEAEGEVDTEAAPGRPLSILEFTETGVKLDTDAFNSVLDKVGKLPLAIYSISGATRSGKSYLLNYFIKYFEVKKQPSSENWMNHSLASSFEWRSGKERETTGMDLWSEPFFVPTNSGQVAVLLMDTQGLFDDQTTARQNAIIFSLTTLCSSVTIFNVIRQVNEDLLQQIQYLSCYADVVSRDSVGDQPAPSNTPTSVPARKGTFQNLLLLLRDFEIPGYAHGLHEMKRKPVESKGNFLHDSFHTDGGPSGCPKENTLVRQGILQNFNQVSAYLLPDPGKDFVTGKSDDPDEDFYKQLKLFIEHMTCSDSLVKKTMDGYECNGTEFKEFVKSWAKLVESEETFPEVFTMAENTAYVQYTIAKEMAISYFTQEMDAFLFNMNNASKLPIGDIISKQKTYSDEALKIFHKMKKFRQNKFDEQFEKQVRDAIGDYLQHSPRMLKLEQLKEEQDRISKEKTKKNQIGNEAEVVEAKPTSKSDQKKKQKKDTEPTTSTNDPKKKQNKDESRPRQPSQEAQEPSCCFIL